MSIHEVALRSAALCAFVAIGLAGCGAEPPVAAVAGEQPDGRMASDPGALFPSGRNAPDGHRLRASAERALREKRLYAPAGNNALEFFLALTETVPNAADRSALIELQPYAVIAAEQALARGDLPETRRLIALVARSDPNAPSLPRLREGVMQAAARLEQDRISKAEAAVRDASPPASPTGAVVPGNPVRSAVAGPAPQNDAAVPAVAIATPARAAAEEPAPRQAPVLPRAQPAIPPRSDAIATLPRQIADAAPRYPLLAMTRKVEGSVQIAFTIRPDGGIEGLRVVSSTPPGMFNRAALAAAEAWRFEASGRSHSTTRTINFSLPDAIREQN